MLLVNRILLDKLYIRKFLFVFFVCLGISVFASSIAYLFVAQKVAISLFSSLHNDIVKNEMRSVFRILSTATFFDSIEAFSSTQAVHFNTSSKEFFWYYSLNLYDPDGKFTVIFKINPFQKNILFTMAMLSIIFGSVLGYFLRQSEISKRVEIERFYRLSSLAKISAKVAHDIRSPLTAINLVSQVIKGDNIDECKTILNSAFERLNQMNSQLFQRAKDAIRQNRDNLSFNEPQLVEKFNSDFLRAEVMKVVKEKLVEHNLVDKQIAVLFPPNTLVGNGNTAEIVRILSNLINNSIESVSVEDQSKIQIQMELKESANSLSLSIVDNGSGIPSEQIEQILKGGTSSKPLGRAQGNGLALFFANEYIREIGGEMQIMSSADFGTKIVLIFSKL